MANPLTWINVPSRIRPLRFNHNYWSAVELADRAEGGGSPDPSQHVKQIQQDDDRDWNPEQP